MTAQRVARWLAAAVALCAAAAVRAGLTTVQREILQANQMLLLSGDDPDVAVALDAITELGDDLLKGPVPEMSTKPRASNLTDFFVSYSLDYFPSNDPFLPGWYPQRGAINTELLAASPDLLQFRSAVNVSTTLTLAHVLSNGDTWFEYLRQTWRSVFLSPSRMLPNATFARLLPVRGLDDYEPNTAGFVEWNDLVKILDAAGVVRWEAQDRGGLELWLWQYETWLEQHMEDAQGLQPVYDLWGRVQLAAISKFVLDNSTTDDRCNIANQIVSDIVNVNGALLDRVPSESAVAEMMETIYMLTTLGGVCDDSASPFWMVPPPSNPDLMEMVMQGMLQDLSDRSDRELELRPEMDGSTAQVHALDAMAVLYDRYRDQDLVTAMVRLMVLNPELVASSRHVVSLTFNVNFELAPAGHVAVLLRPLSCDALQLIGRQCSANTGFSFFRGLGWLAFGVLVAGAAAVVAVAAFLLVRRFGCCCSFLGGHGGGLSIAMSTLPVISSGPAVLKVDENQFNPLDTHSSEYDVNKPRQRMRDLTTGEQVLKVMELKKMLSHQGSGKRPAPPVHSLQQQPQQAQAPARSPRHSESVPMAVPDARATHRSASGRSANGKQMRSPSSNGRSSASSPLVNRLASHAPVQVGPEERSWEAMTSGPRSGPGHNLQPLQAPLQPGSEERSWEAMASGPRSGPGHNLQTLQAQTMYTPTQSMLHASGTATQSQHSGSLYRHESGRSATAALHSGPSHMSAGYGSNSGLERSHMHGGYADGTSESAELLAAHRHVYIPHPVEMPMRDTSRVSWPQHTLAADGAQDFRRSGSPRVDVGLPQEGVLHPAVPPPHADMATVLLRNNSLARSASARFVRSAAFTGAESHMYAPGADRHSQGWYQPHSQPHPAHPSHHSQPWGDEAYWARNAPAESSSFYPEPQFAPSQPLQSPLSPRASSAALAQVAREAYPHGDGAPQANTARAALDEAVSALHQAMGSPSIQRGSTENNPFRLSRRSSFQRSTPPDSPCPSDSASGVRRSTQSGDLPQSPVHGSTHSGPHAAPHGGHPFGSARAPSAEAVQTEAPSMPSSQIPRPGGGVPRSPRSPSAASNPSWIWKQAHSSGAEAQGQRDVDYITPSHARGGRRLNSASSHIHTSQSVDSGPSSVRSATFAVDLPSGTTSVSPTSSSAAPQQPLPPLPPGQIPVRNPEPPPRPKSQRMPSLLLTRTVQSVDSSMGPSPASSDAGEDEESFTEDESSGPASDGDGDGRGPRPDDWSALLPAPDGMSTEAFGPPVRTHISKCVRAAVEGDSAMESIGLTVTLRPDAVAAVETPSRRVDGADTETLTLPLSGRVQAYSTKASQGPFNGNVVEEQGAWRRPSPRRRP